MNDRRSKKKAKQFTENRLEKKRVTVAEQEKIRAKEEQKRRNRKHSMHVVRAVKKTSEPTYLTMVFSVILNLLLGTGFTLMLTSTYNLPVNIYIFIPLLLLLSLGISYCHGQKEKLTSFLLAGLLASTVWCFFMTDLFHTNAQTRLVYSTLQQRVFHAWKPMWEADLLIERRRDVTILMWLVNFIPTYFTSLTIEKRRSIFLSLIWYIPLLFGATVTSSMTPKAIPCQLAVAGILLLLIFHFVRRLGDTSTDKRMLMITAPVLILSFLIGGLFPKESYSYDKLAASHFQELRGFIQDLRGRLKIGGEPEKEEEQEEKGPGYVGSISFSEAENPIPFMNVFEEDLSKVGFFEPDDTKLMTISRFFNDTENHSVLVNNRMIYLRSTCMEIMSGNSWRTFSPSEERELTDFYSEDNECPQSEADFVLRVRTLYPFEAYLVPYYTDHFYISEESKYSDLDIITHTTWNLYERIPNSGVQDYDYAFNTTPRKSQPEWNPDYLEEEVYGVCLEVPEKTKNSILKIKKLPDWYKELLDGTRTMTTSEKVNAVVEYVRKLHPYDPDTPYPPEGADFVTWFITQSKTGFCVHYATTAAVLLRLIGVPTRYATGYLVGSDPFVASNDVLMRDAHAWFEFFDPDYGWVLDDPTPGNAFNVSYYNAYAIAKEYGDMNYDYRETPTPSPTPSPTPTPTVAPVQGTIYGPTLSPNPTATPIPESTFGLPFKLPPVILVILLVLVIVAAVLALLRLLYVLFWKIRFKKDPLSRRAIEYTRYFNMHLYILEAADSRVVRSIFTKAEYSNENITEEELKKLIRFGLHNLDKQIPGRNVLRRMLSKILRVSL